jgi:hypothetical protein
MKKLMLISVLVCFAGINQLFSANPIPSYNVLVTGRAIFQEGTKPISGNTVSDERRQMNVQTSTASPTNGFALLIVAVKVYRLDGAITMGPYYLQVGQSLGVRIDDKRWGVDVVSEQTSRVSVWTSTDQRFN